MLRPIALGFLLFVVAEMATLIALGKWIGILPTILIVLGGGVVGAWLAKWQGVRTAMRARSRLAQGALPAVEMSDGLMIWLAAVLFMIPGVLTDVLGLALLLPPTRSLLRHAVMARFSRRTFLGAKLFGERKPRGAAASSSAPPRGDQIIDARVIETRVVDE
jgi:UPF0716 protein FxsA